MINSELCRDFLDNEEKEIGLFLVDKELNIISWNSGCENLFGYLKSEVLEKNLTTIIPSHSVEGFVNDIVEKKSLDFVEVEFQTKTNQVLFLNTTLRYAHDRVFFMVFAPNKEAKKLELKDILNPSQLKDVVISIDKNGYIREFNEEASLLTGYKKDEAIDRNFIELFLPSTYEEKLLAQIQMTFRKKSLYITDNFPIVCKDGSKRKVYWEYRLFNHNHRDQRLFLVSPNQTKESMQTQKLDYLASYDLLTDLPNKNLFMQKLQSSMDKVARSKNLNLLLAILDIKDFKSINLSLGINSGDSLLQLVAKRLNSKLRDYDTIARVDGDRFAIVVDDIENDAFSSKILNRILELFKAPFEIDGNTINLEVSIGASMFPADSNDIETLINSADLALSKAKKFNKSEYRFFMPSMYEEMTKKIQMDKALKDALKNDEFFVVFQPLVDAKTKEIKGAEALVRWEHPELKNIPPLDFIPTAEDNGLILEIGELVLKESIKYAKQIQQDGWKDFKISVNISSIQLLQSDLLKTVNTFLETYNFDPKYLNLELTESVFMENLNLCTKLLKEFKKLGISISIDDFGTGYSSLSYVSKLPIDNIKIDQSFVQDISAEKNPIIDAIISMAHALGLNVVAEGVENDKQYNYLKSKNCDIIQGYYFSKPLNIEKFQNFQQSHFVDGTNYINSENIVSQSELKELIR